MIIPLLIWLSAIGATEYQTQQLSCDDLRWYIFEESIRSETWLSEEERDWYRAEFRQDPEHKVYAICHLPYGEPTNALWACRREELKCSPSFANPAKWTPAECQRLREQIVFRDEQDWMYDTDYEDYLADPYTHVDDDHCSHIACGDFDSIENLACNKHYRHCEGIPNATRTLPAIISLRKWRPW